MRIRTRREFRFLPSTMKQNQFTCGNFAVTFAMKPELEIPAEVEELVTSGITQILQRKPASAWEKWAAGYEKRPEGFQRNSIEFSHSRATKMEELFSEAVAKWATVTVAEYVPEERVGKFKEEIDAIARHEQADDVEEWLEKTIGFKGEYVDDSTESGYSIEALKAVNAYKRDFLKRGL